MLVEINEAFRQPEDGHVTRSAIVPVSDPAAGLVGRSGPRSRRGPGQPGGGCGPYSFWTSSVLTTRSTPRTLAESASARRRSSGDATEPLR